MPEILDARIITIDDAQDAGTVNCIIDYDWEGNMYDKDDEGNPVTTTTFYEDEIIDLLLQLPPGYNLVSIKTTTGSRIETHPIVSRVVEVKDQFFEDTELKDIAWYPNGTPVLTDIHRAPITPIVAIEDKKMKVNYAPVILDFYYGITAYSFKTIHPAGIDLADDEVFPQGIIVEVSKG